MNSFNFLRKKKNSVNEPILSDSITPNSSAATQNKVNENPLDAFYNSQNGIDQVYAFLQTNYESRGYNDSFVNPEESYKTDNMKLIKFDLQILIDRTSAYYDNLTSEINFHIATRHKAGLDDLVQELEARNKLIEEYKKRLQIIKESINDENSMSQRIILSYQRGFLRGLSVLTQSNILSKKL